MAKKPARYEGSALDTKRDKAGAKKAGVSAAKWQGSKADEKIDRKGQAKLDAKAKR
jgi:hypothetical protein